MADQDDRRHQGRRPPEQTVQNTRIPDMGPEGGGPATPGRAGTGMGVDTGDYTDVPPDTTPDGPSTTVTVGEDTGQRRDLPDQDGPNQDGVPPTPKNYNEKRRRAAEDRDRDG